MDSFLIQVVETLAKSDERESRRRGGRLVLQRAASPVALQLL